MTTQRISDYHAALAVKVTPTVRREVWLDHMTFAANGGPMFTEIFGPLPGLKDEWAAQGASAEEIDLSAFRFRAPMTGGLPIATGFINGQPERIIEEDGEYLTAIDAMGRTVRLAKLASSLPLPLDYPVKDMDDWLAFKHHYEFDESRLAGDFQAAAAEHLDAGRAVTVGIPGGFDSVRQLLGPEAACMACYDQPELILDILTTIADTAERVLEAVSAAVTIDVLTVHEDMAGRSGPLWGPSHVAEFIAPYYRRIRDMLFDRGCRLFDQDSDGDMRPVIDAFLDAGVNVMHPCEPAAGMDVVEIREQYGSRLALVGGLDKHVIRRSREEIVAELERKIPPMVRTGGCVLGLDHRIPNGTPIANYRFYVETAWSIMTREAEALGLPLGDD